MVRAALSGLIGATVLTLIHQTARTRVPEAPRMDLLGMRSIVKTVNWFGQKPPTGRNLYNLTLAGDVISNAAYYSLIGIGNPKGALLRGILLGGAAGLGGVVLPGPLGLGEAPSGRTPETKAMTVGWYLAGGIAAALAYRLLEKPLRRA